MTRLQGDLPPFRFEDMSFAQLSEKFFTDEVKFLLVNRERMDGAYERKSFLFSLSQDPWSTSPGEWLVFPFGLV